MGENNQEQEKSGNNQEKKNISENKMKELFSWQGITIMIGIIILVIVGFLYFRNKVSSPVVETSPTNSTSSNETTTSSTPAQSSNTNAQTKIPAKKNQFEKNQSSKPASNKQATPKKSEQKQPISQEVQIQDKSIIVNAAPGDGITQLARRALSEYIKQHPDSGKKLTKEHRVYIEDYLKDQIVRSRNGRKLLAIGEKISFSDNLIQDAIQNSQKLTQKQLDYLKRFSRMIDWSKV